jgi:prepilin-type N-terminal cleavage/methylation domain-containing protein
MTKYRNNSAFTLIEMIVVIAIIVILAAMSAMLLRGSDDSAKTELTKQAFGIIDSALEEYRDFGYSLRVNSTAADELAFYQGLKFPIDCNNFTMAQMRAELEMVLSKAVSIVPDDEDPNSTGAQAMYFFLSQVPQCRDILQAIPQKLLTNLNKSKNPVYIELGGNGIKYPFNKFIDPWGTPLRYDFYINIAEQTAALTYAQRTDTILTFPLITSAGPDRVFGTGDDIKSR